MSNLAYQNQALKNESATIKPVAGLYSIATIQWVSDKINLPLSDAAKLITTTKGGLVICDSDLLSETTTNYEIKKLKDKWFLCEEKVTAANDVVLSGQENKSQFRTLHEISLTILDMVRAHLLQKQIDSVFPSEHIMEETSLYGFMSDELKEIY